MEQTTTLKSFSAARMIASAFGILAGIGGLTHGVGEVLQGNVAADGIIINSWTQGPIAAMMGGEPAMTIIPILLITGIVNILVSLSVIVWSAAFVHRKHGGLILILLTIAMLLVGGGFGPIVIGLLAGVAGLGINAAYPRWRKRLSDGFRRLLSSLWPWIFGICLADTVFLVIGSLILVYVLGIGNADLFVYSFFFATVSLIVTIFVGIARDIQHQQVQR